MKREKCGTYAGTGAHRRLGEDVCDDCRQAATNYVREWRRRTGRTTHRLVPVEVEADR